MTAAETQDKREAGRETDVEIAEFMGAVWGVHEGVREGCEWLCVPGSRAAWGGPEILAVRGALASGRTLDVWDDCPHYSTDIAAAFLVVEKAVADGWFPEVQFNNWGVESWYATMSRTTDDPMGGYASGIGATAPLAICRAALKAVASSPSLVVQETDT